MFVVGLREISLHRIERLIEWGIEATETTREEGPHVAGAEDALINRFADLIQELPAGLCEEPSEAWHERILSRQLAEAAVLAKPFEGLDEFDWLATSRVTPMAPTSAGTAITAVSSDMDAVVERLQERADWLLARIEDLEAERARLDGRIVDAYGAFRAVVAEQVAHLEVEFSPGLVSRRRRETPAERAVNVDVTTVDEIATATAVPAGEAARRLRLAEDAIRYAPLRDRLAVGSVSLLHAGLIADEVAALANAEGWDEAEHDEMLAVVAERVLAPLPNGHRPTHPHIRQRLTRVLKSLQDPAAAKARREKAAARRRLTAELTEDGMGILALHLPAERLPVPRCCSRAAESTPRPQRLGWQYCRCDRSGQPMACRALCSRSKRIGFPGATRSRCRAHSPWICLHPRYRS